MKKSSIWPTAIGAVVLALIGGAFCAWHVLVHPEPQLDYPDSRLSVRPEGLSQLVTAANEHRTKTAVFFKTRLHMVDKDQFVIHLYNIAAQRGWYPHGGGKRYALVVPEADLPVLYELSDDPVAWVNRYADQDRRAPPAGDLNPVNVRVKVCTARGSAVPMIFAVLIWVLSAVLVIGVVNRLLEIEPATPGDEPG